METKTRNIKRKKRKKNVEINMKRICKKEDGNPHKLVCGEDVEI